jgi:uncharacterized protein YegL
MILSVNTPARSAAAAIAAAGRSLDAAVAAAVACAMLLAGALGGGWPPAPPAADEPPPSVCRATVALRLPDPLISCRSAALTAAVRPNCGARRVHIVYIVNANRAYGGSGLYLRREMKNSIRAMGLRDHPNIRVAAVYVTENDAVLAQGFTNLIGEAFYGFRVHGGAFGCRRCGLQTALEALIAARAGTGDDRPAEFIAFFGYLGTEDEEVGLDQVIQAMRDERVILIGPNRELATSDLYWTAGRWPISLIFRRIATDFSGTVLKRLALELQLPAEAPAIPLSARPPALGEPERLRWAFDDPPLEGVTVTLDLDVRAPLGSGPHLDVHLEDWRGRQSDLQAQTAAPPAVLDGCLPTATPPPPLPGTPTATPPDALTATSTRPPPTPGPTPTLSRRGPSPVFLPYLLHDPCSASPRRLDVLLVVDTSSSMRTADHNALADVADAGLAFLEVLRSAGDTTAPGARRVGLVRFDARAELLLPLSPDWGAVRDVLVTLAQAPVNPGTRIDLGLGLAIDHLEAAGWTANQPAIVLLTDGEQLAYMDEVLQAALRAEHMGIAIYAVGIGPAINARHLEAIAGDPARFALAAERDELLAVYREIAHALRCEVGGG